MTINNDDKRKLQRAMAHLTTLTNERKQDSEIRRLLGSVIDLCEAVKKNH